MHRGRLNLLLLDAAEAAGARLRFDTRRGRRRLQPSSLMRSSSNERDGRERRTFPSRCCLARTAPARLCAGRWRQETVELGERSNRSTHGYKELEIPPAADGGFRLEPNALYIWPRGTLHMCIALPNTEHTFTVTLFLPLQSEGGAPRFRRTIPGRRTAAQVLFSAISPTRCL